MNMKKNEDREVSIKREFSYPGKDYIRRKLQIAFDQVDRGEVSDLDTNALLAEAHRRHRARQK